MAKRKKVSKAPARAKSKKSFYKPETYGVKYNSLTFLLFLVFVLVATMIVFAKIFGMSFY